MDENVINSQRTIPSSAAQPRSHAVVSRDDDTIWSWFIILRVMIPRYSRALTGLGAIRLSCVCTHFCTALESTCTDRSPIDNRVRVHRTVSLKGAPFNNWFISGQWTPGAEKGEQSLSSQSATAADAMTMGSCSAVVFNEVCAREGDLWGWHCTHIVCDRHYELN